MKRFKLFCIPYAGGSALVYNQWGKYIKDKVEIIPIELKGRGIRTNEVHYTSIEDAVEDVFQVIKDNIHGCDYAIFGHSMGSLIAYEVCKKITSEKIEKPKHMFFSGRQAPNFEFKNKYYELDDDEFLLTIQKYGGFSEGIIQNIEIMKYFIPILRNDFKIVEQYEDIYKAKIDIDSSVFIGKEDSISVYEAIEWKDYVVKNCDIYMFNGGHFFIKDSFLDVINRISIILNKNHIIWHKRR